MAARTRSRNGGNPVGMQLGLSGLKRSYGYVYEELLPQLQGRKAVNVYQEMSQNSAVIGATLFAIDMFMRKVGWRVEAASQSGKDQKNAKFLMSCKDDLAHTWPDFISEVNSMLTFGWSWFEIIYKKRQSDSTDMLGNAVSKYDDGMIGWHKFDIRSQESWWRWDFDPETGDTIGMWQRPAPDYSERYLPSGKSLLFRTTSRKNSPEGVSVLRTAYRSWYFLKRIEEIEAIGIERDLAGIPIATVPAEMLGPNASADDQKLVASIVDLVRNVRRDQQEGIVWPQAYDSSGKPLYGFELLTSGGTRQFPTDPIISRYESRIAMTVLADFILLGNDANSGGSFALSTSKTGMFQSALSTWLDSIENVLNEQAIPRLFRLNGIKGPYPKFRHDIVQQPAINDLAVFISAMAGAGAQLFPDTTLENHLREVAQLPIRESNEKLEGIENDILQQQLETMLASSAAEEDIAQRTARDQQAEGIVPLPQGSIVARMDPLTVVPPAGAPGQAGTGAVQAPKASAPATQKVANVIGMGGKQKNSKPGAPTKSTGNVKSKLPPANRRSTISTRAQQNTKPKSNTSPTSVAKKFRVRHPASGSAQSARVLNRVKAQMSTDFPADSMGWMDQAAWRGPVEVPLSSLDFSNEHTWAASHELGKVYKFARKIMAGKMKPIVCVKTPGSDKYKIIDGHHHALAYKKLGHDPVVYIGDVSEDNGPWDDMHSKQRTEPGEDASGYEPGDKGGVKKSATLSKESVHYRSGTSLKHCGNCDMFRADSPGSSEGSCTLVKGAIEDDDVCDRWYAKKKLVMKVSLGPCSFCARKATQVIRSKDGRSRVPCCSNHTDAAKAEMRWQANNQVSPVNPSPYMPFDRVIAE